MTLLSGPLSGVKGWVDHWLDPAEYQAVHRSGRWAQEWCQFQSNMDWT